MYHHFSVALSELKVNELQLAKKKFKLGVIELLLIKKTD